MIERTKQTTDHRHRLRLPTGTETMHLLEAARHRRITRVLEDRFTLWGYTPAETPLVDYVEVYRPLLSEKSMRDTYRAVDRQGEVLAVRADTTLFLAKQLGLHLCPEDLPVRVWYNDQIVRAEGEDEIAGNEYQQAGVELVGTNGVESDVEVLTILQDTLQALGLSEAVIHIGSHRIITELTSSDDGREAMARHVLARRRVPEEFGLSRDEQDLLLFIGDAPAFEQALERWTLPAGVRSAAEDLLVRAVQLEADPAVRIDLSELAANDYYSGIAFSAYHPDSTAAITRGGRYDELLGHFGFDAPSVGFSMFTRKLPATTLSGIEPDPPGAPGSTLAERIATARAAHGRGERMRL